MLSFSCELRDEKCGYEDLNDLSISAYDSPPERMEPATSLYESKVVQPNTTQQHATPQYLSYTNRCKSRYIKAYHSPITSLNDEQLVWVSWLEHASLMARSNLGVRYLCSCIPRVAWSYQPAFNALKAFVVVLESLKRKDDEIAFARHKKEALMHANKSIQGLIHFDGPAEVVLVVATLFWMYEALAGNWKASESHLDHGWNISRQTCDQDLSEPFIAHFISAIAAAFPSTVNPRNLLSMTDEEQEKHHQNRKRHAHQFMTHALRKLRQFQRTVEAQEGVSFGRTFPEIADAERQLCSVIASWPTVVPTPRSELLTVDKVSFLTPFRRYITLLTKHRSSKLSHLLFPYFKTSIVSLKMVMKHICPCLRQTSDRPWTSSCGLQQRMI